jgi:hypothetical protein
VNTIPARRVIVPTHSPSHLHQNNDLDDDKLRADPVRCIGKLNANSAKYVLTICGAVPMLEQLRGPV